MKKLVSIMAIILCGICLCSCAVKLPDGMTEEKVTASAQSVVELLNSKDYDAFNELCEPVLTDAFANAPLSDVWEPVLNEAGTFEQINKTSLQSSKGYAVAVVQAKYSNKSIVFTLSFNSEYKLGGIYFK